MENLVHSADIRFSVMHIPWQKMGCLAKLDMLMMRTRMTSSESLVACFPAAKVYLMMMTTTMLGYAKHILLSSSV